MNEHDKNLITMNGFSEWVSWKRKTPQQLHDYFVIFFPVDPAHFKRREISRCKICSISSCKNATEIRRIECMATIDRVWCVFWAISICTSRAQTTIQWKKFRFEWTRLRVWVVFFVHFTKKSNIFIILSRVHMINRTLNEPFRKKSVPDGLSIMINMQSCISRPNKPNFQLNTNDF